MPGRVKELHFLLLRGALSSQKHLLGGKNKRRQLRRKTGKEENALEGSSGGVQYGDFKVKGFICRWLISR